MWRRRSATTAHRALPVCEWPALGMALATARSNAASAVSSSRGGACTGCCSQAVRVVCGGFGFAEECGSFTDVEAPLGNHCAKSPANVWVASPGHTMGHCKVKCSLCSVQQVWWSLHWGLRPGWAVGLLGVLLC